MVTRKEKREQEKNTNYFFEFTKIKRHFFRELNKKLKRVKDPRHRSYITYNCDIILLMMILKNVCNLESMRGMTNQFNKEECIENLKNILGLDTLTMIPSMIFYQRWTRQNSRISGRT